MAPIPPPPPGQAVRRKEAAFCWLRAWAQLGQAWHESGLLGYPEAEVFQSICHSSWMRCWGLSLGPSAPPASCTQMNQTVLGPPQAFPTTIHLGAFLSWRCWGLKRGQAHNLPTDLSTQCVSWPREALNLGPPSPKPELSCHHWLTPDSTHFQT